MCIYMYVCVYIRLRAGVYGVLLILGLPQLSSLKHIDLGQVLELTGAQVSCIIKSTGKKIYTHTRTHTYTRMHIYLHIVGFMYVSPVTNTFKGYLKCASLLFLEEDSRSTSAHVNRFFSCLG